MFPDIFIQEVQRMILQKPPNQDERMGESVGTQLECLARAGSVAQ
jgi:hypothetical protein